MNDVVRLLVFRSALEIASLFANWMMNSGSQIRVKFNGARLKAMAVIKSRFFFFFIFINQIGRMKT